MSNASEARQSTLDRVLDAGRTSSAVAQDLFAVVDAVSAQPTLRRALTDPGTPDAARAQLVEALFASRIGPEAVRVLAEASTLRWATAGAFVAALERQGVRALLGTAQDEGRLAEVEDQLFKVGRLVDGSRELKAALGDRRAPLAARADLLTGLLDGRTDPLVTELVRRAVAARQRTFELTLEGYLKVAAELKQRAIATVEVARPLTDDQLARLTAALRRQVGREVSVRVLVDPAVLGGVRVTVGDEVIEGTVSGRLHDAHRKLG